MSIYSQDWIYNDYTLDERWKLTFTYCIREKRVLCTSDKIFQTESAPNARDTYFILSFTLTLSRNIFQHLQFYRGNRLDRFSDNLYQSKRHRQPDALSAFDITYDTARKKTSIFRWENSGVTLPVESGTTAYSRDIVTVTRSPFLSLTIIVQALRERRDVYLLVQAERNDTDSYRFKVTHFPNC